MDEEPRREIQKDEEIKIAKRVVMIIPLIFSIYRLKHRQI